MSNLISPIDYRYLNEDLARMALSEEAFLHHKLKVESALAATLADYNICSEEVAEEIHDACFKTSIEEVYEEEGRIKYDIRAMVNCIRKKVSDEAKPFVHLMATSYDIVETANAMRYKVALVHFVIPKLQELIKTLIDLALAHTETVQVGRTHGQHAVPITFGFALTEYVCRLGRIFEKLRDFEFFGKFSGAVGAHNSQTIFLDEPLHFEKDVLETVSLRPAEFSTQIIPPENNIRFFIELVLASGVMANLARDMRNLHRTEIQEVGELYSKERTGSSAMPHKNNPSDFENVESIAKIISTRAPLLFLDQISDHQRDLTNSASSRTYGEIIAYFVYMTEKLNETIKTMKVNEDRMRENLKLSNINSEAIYLILAKNGHPDAHEKVRQDLLEGRDPAEGLDLDGWEKSIIQHPEEYYGLAKEKGYALLKKWERMIS